MKNIGIFEIKYHHVYLSNMCRICKTENTEVTVFTTPNIFLKLKHVLRDTSQFRFVIKKENENYSSFFRRVEKICNKEIDLLFVNTIQGNLLDLFHFLRFNPKTKKILTIHNVNLWLKPRITLKIKNGKHYPAILRTINSDICSMIRHLILPKYDAINVLYPPMKNYILENTSYKKDIYTIPHSFYEEIPILQKTHDDLRFLIPGVILEGRGDYKTLIKIFREIFPIYSNIEVYLLGYPKDRYGYEIIQQCKKLEDQGFKIYYFNKPIPYNTWRNIFIESDVAILPFKKYYAYDSNNIELWGTTKASGSMFECIQYAKPFIVPHYFNLMEEIKTSTLKYEDSEDLKKLIERLINDKEKINYLKKEALKNSKKFSLQNIQKYFKKEILKEKSW